MSPEVTATKQTFVGVILLSISPYENLTLRLILGIIYIQYKVKVALRYYEVLYV